MTKFCFNCKKKLTQADLKTVIIDNRVSLSDYVLYAVYRIGKSEWTFCSQCFNAIFDLKQQS